MLVVSSLGEVDSAAVADCSRTAPSAEELTFSSVLQVFERLVFGRFDELSSPFTEIHSMGKFHGHSMIAM